ncbi:MAG TPA: polyprenyl synthetase family protein, partial [Solirubrobacterales bacterium]|nr:polyprenyl synthetase family protein [Solirubrobacterales bacterium]
YSEAASRVCDGQMLEICDLFDTERDERRYFEAIGGKTAALFELCAVLGAQLAVAEQSTVEMVKRFGWELGLAFQILDDVTDLLLGEPSTGKAVGKDLLQGVVTLPVIYAIEEEPALGERLVADLDAKSLPELLKEVSATGGPARAVEQAAARAASARGVAAAMPAGQHLVEIAEQMAIEPLKRLS